MSRPTLSASIVRLPARIQAGGGVASFREGGKDTIYQDWTNLGTSPAPTTPGNYEFLIRNIDSGELTRVSASDVLPTSGSSPRNTAQGRLTLSATQPITQADFTASSTIYYLPSGGQLVPVWNGSAMAWLSIDAGLILPLDADPSHDGFHAVQYNYDLFVILDGGIVRLVTGPPWSTGAIVPPNFTKERSTGLGSSELTVRNGVIVNKNVFTIRKGTAAGDVVSVQPFFATYVGTFKASANGVARDTRRQRLLYNAYNQAPRVLQRLVHDASWQWHISAYRQMNADPLNQIEVVFGLDGGVVDLTCKANCINSTESPQACFMGIGQDTIAAVQNFSHVVASSQLSSTTSRWVLTPGLGFSYFAMMERGAGVVGQIQYWYGGAELIGTVML